MPLLLGKSTYPACSDFRSHISGRRIALPQRTALTAIRMTHPFAADIVIMFGGYVEHVFDLDQPYDPPLEVERREGGRFHNEACTVHRIIQLTAPEGLNAVPAGAA
ncbi:hypothetical protein [Paracoccus mutanolyticus]|nr:hypothetical protein [Paracoccus mutanolyticus]